MKYKKYISKLNLIFLITLFISTCSQILFAAIIVDKEKAYNICLEYHHGPLENLCEKIKNENMSYDDILNAHRNKGRAEVEAEKENFTVDNTNKETKQNQTTKTPQNNTTESKQNQTTKTPQNNTTESKQNQTTKTPQNNTSESKRNENNESNSLKKQILSFAYSSAFWKLFNITMLVFFTITYIIDRIKYFKRRNKKK